MFCVCFLMKKMVSVLKVIGIVVLVLVILIAGVGLYFYNFYVFKTVRICLGDGVDSGIPCDSAQDCVDLISEHGFDVDLSEMPDFVGENLQVVVDEAIYCDGVCFVRDVRGVDYETQELEMLESCEVGEIEFAIDIRGKEGIEVLKYLKGME